MHNIKRNPLVKTAMKLCMTITLAPWDWRVENIFLGKPKYLFAYFLVWIPFVFVLVLHSFRRLCIYCSSFFRNVCPFPWLCFVRCYRCNYISIYTSFVVRCSYHSFFCFTELYIYIRGLYLFLANLTHFRSSILHQMARKLYNTQQLVVYPMLSKGLKLQILDFHQ